ncbi:hypothetical protein [Streptomyces endophyticus]|uniref:Uncharacterized protein n=1 Tax=Streptomyces endophyticus TaxID=714166 RepID=A0ABU6F324_9ACTN|nr:hypothetical protein [Streptomyces endophyticus]MEB8338388.1 hypothetical protein [Streptomyces endophyticus]
MSRTSAAHGRRMFTGTDTSGAAPVDYRFFHARGGNRRLVVVFANFQAPDEYGWSTGVLDTLRANVLWIRDSFDGHNSYYLCQEGDFGIEDSVAALIDRFVTALDLTREDCVLLGTSKGGSAALYFGLKYGYRNIVSVVPQFRIGSYVENLHPRTAAHMLGRDATDADVRALDEALPALVRESAHRDANIYLISAVDDPQYTTEIEPHLTLFAGYDNFNFILTDSPHAPAHDRVARRNVPVVMALVNLLIDGIAPRIGFARNGYEDPDTRRPAVDAHLRATAAPGTWVEAPQVTAPEAGHEPVRFAGVAAGAAQVQLWENARFLGRAQVAEDGAWSWTPRAPMARGEHVVKVLALNAHGADSERTVVRCRVRNDREVAAAA